MAIGALGILGGFAGGAADAIQEGEKLRLQNNADQRAQEAHEEEMKVKRRDFANQAAFAQLSNSDDNNLVYEGGNFPTPGYPTAAAAAGQTSTGTTAMGPTRWDDQINSAAQKYGMSPDTLKRFVGIESGGNPNATTGRYHGLLQLSRPEFEARGGTNIFDPQQNLDIGAQKLAQEAAQFKAQYGRDPDAADLYMIHQQGAGGAANHMANPNDPAWLNMYKTGEGRMKGPAWAKLAIWGNVPDSQKARFGSVENVTSKDFTDMWRNRVNNGSFSGGAQGRTTEAPTESAPISQPSQDDAFAGALAPQPTALPGQKTAALNTGTATDAAPAAALPSSVPAAVARVNGQPSPEDQVTQALATSSNAPAPQKLAADQVVVQDPHTGLYHAVPRDQTRKRNDLEQTQAAYNLLMKQGRVDEAARFLYNQTQAATMRNKLEIEQQNRELGVAAAAGPGALAEKATQIMQKNGMHGEVIPETLAGPDGQPVTVLKVNPKGTNGPPAYLTSNGMSLKPDLSTDSYSGAVNALQGALSGQKMADTMADWVKYQTSVSNAREAHIKANVAEQTQGAQVAAANLGPAKTRAEIAASQAAANTHAWASTQYGAPPPSPTSYESWKRQQILEQNFAGANKEIGELEKNGLLDRDPLKRSQQIGEIRQRWGVAPQNDFTTGGKGAPSPAPSGIPAPAPAPAAPQATAIPAPRDNTAAGLAKTLQGIPARQQAAQQAQVKDEAIKQQEKDAKLALSGHDISSAHWRVYSALQAGKAPLLSDVRALHGVITHFPGATGLMKDPVLEYVQRYGG